MIVNRVVSFKKISGKKIITSKPDVHQTVEKNSFKSNPTWLPCR